MRRNATRARIEIVENRQHRVRLLRRAHQANPRARHNSQRAFAADNGAQQIEAGRIFDAAAQPHDFALRCHQFDAQRVIDGDAIFERVRPARIGRDISANRASRLTRRIGRETKAERRRRLRQVHVDYTRLD